MMHYCAMWNRPYPVMDNSSTDSIHFSLTDSIGIDPAEDARMHASAIRFIDKHTIEQERVMHQDGQPVDSAMFRLQRAGQS